jgi:hypothetical protein
MSNLDQSNNFLHASLMYFAGDIHTSKEVSGDWFSEQKEKMPKL